MSDLQQIAETQAAQGEKIVAIEKACARIETNLLGNGKPGLVIRTDRLEQKNKFNSRLFWIFATATVALVIKTVGVDLIGAFMQTSGQ
jgi:hypothetical protein